MEDSKKTFDPYAEWFQIPTQQRPPDHYALLGLAAFEDDEQKIDAAAKQRAAHLHQLAAGPRRKEVQQLLGEIATARRTLINPESREAYNESLKSPSVTAVPTIQLQDRDEDRRRQATKKRPQKKQSSDTWIYLLTACSVVLLIVAGIVFYMRSGPRRMAAEPMKIDEAERSRARRNRLSDAQRLKAKRRMVFDSLADVSQPERFPMRTPDAATTSPETKESGGSNLETSPPSSAIRLPKGWIQDVPLLCDFSDPTTIPMDDEEMSAQGLVVSNERLQMPPSSGPENSVLPLAPGRNLDPGTAVSLRTRIPANNKKVRIGVMAGGCALALRVEKIGKQNRLALRANDDQQLGVFEQPGAADLTLTVIRPETVADELWWVVAFKNRVYGGRVKSQRIEATDGVRFTWFNGNPKLQPPLWIDDVRFGPCAAPEPLAKAPSVVIPDDAKK